jgi:hypothetical protein
VSTQYTPARPAWMQASADHSPLRPANRA